VHIQLERGGDAASCEREGWTGDPVSDTDASPKAFAARPALRLLSPLVGQGAKASKGATASRLRADAPQTESMSAKITEYEC